MIENIQYIKDNIAILDIIQAYIPLRRNGTNYTSLCPFHNEKTSSFVVSPQKNIFHCFGCGIGGNGIDFIMKYEEIDFLDAIQTAAEICCIDVEINKIKTNKTDKLIDMEEKLQVLNENMRKKLLQHEKLLGYLLSRGLQYEHIEKFGIGLMVSKNELLQILGADYCKELGYITEKGNIFF